MSRLNAKLDLQLYRNNLSPAYLFFFSVLFSWDSTAICSCSTCYLASGNVLFHILFVVAALSLYLL